MIPVRDDDRNTTLVEPQELSLKEDRCVEVVTISVVQVTSDHDEVDRLLER